MLQKMGPEISLNWVLSGPLLIKHGNVFTKKKVLYIYSIFDNMQKYEIQ